MKYLLFYMLTGALSAVILHSLGTDLAPVFSETAEQIGVPFPLLGVLSVLVLLGKDKDKNKRFLTYSSVCIGLLYILVVPFFSGMPFLNATCSGVTALLLWAFSLYIGYMSTWLLLLFMGKAVLGDWNGLIPFPFEADKDDENLNIASA